MEQQKEKAAPREKEKGEKAQYPWGWGRKKKGKLRKSYYCGCLKLSQKFTGDIDIKSTQKSKKPLKNVVPVVERQGQVHNTLLEWGCCTSMPNCKGKRTRGVPLQVLSWAGGCVLDTPFTISHGSCQEYFQYHLFWKMGRALGTRGVLLVKHVVSNNIPPGVVFHIRLETHIILTDWSARGEAGKESGSRSHDSRRGCEARGGVGGFWIVRGVLLVC